MVCVLWCVVRYLGLYGNSLSSLPANVFDKLTALVYAFPVPFHLSLIMPPCGRGKSGFFSGRLDEEARCA